MSDRCEPSVEVIDISLDGLGSSVGLSVDTSAFEDRYQTTCGGGGNSADQPIAVRISEPGVFTATVVAAEGFDTVLFLRSRCEVPDSELACNDDTNELLSEVSLTLLDAGVYYLFLDGFGNARGVAELELSLRPLTECVNDRDCESGSCVDGVCGAPECVGDQDCGFNQVCNAGTCVDGVRCFDDSECGAGEICEGFTCEPGECTQDTDCGIRQICDANRCVRPECRRDTDCPGNERCDLGRCVESCNVDSDCGDAFSICVSSACVPAECLRDDQCAADESCNNGRCVAGSGGGGNGGGGGTSGQEGDSCASDNNCSGSLICEGEICESAEGLCVEASDCDDASACLGGRCVSAPACQTADDCSGLIPIPVPLLCINSECRSAISQCSFNRDCGAGQSCAFGLCIPLPSNECLRDSDCDSGLCEGGSCQ